MIFSVSGHVEKPGNFELPMGIPFRDLLEIAGGVRGGRKLKAVIPGGSSVPVLPAALIMDCTMDYDSLRKAGSSVGTGAMIVMDETTCMVRVLERISRFYMAESCGQCTPCREGTGWLTRMLRRILAGQGKLSDLDLLVAGREPDRGAHDLRARRRRGLAGAELPEHFRHEFDYMIEHGGKSIVDAPAQAVA